jgi:CYTH domain-containing protein
MHDQLPEMPRYSLAEVERRWLVPSAYLQSLEGREFMVIEDLYIRSSLLRLRKVVSVHGECVYKLCKKYGGTTPLSNPITNIYLSRDEYRLLSELAGARIHKRRYPLAGGAIDVFPQIDQLAIFEMEFDTEQIAKDHVPPDFVGDEITGDVRYAGATLAWGLA